MKQLKNSWALISFAALVIVVAFSVFDAIGRCTAVPEEPQSQLVESNLKEYYEVAQIVRVVDGDTLEVVLQGVTVKVRLIGIDCPESVSLDESENCEEGKIASQYVKTFIKEGDMVYLQKDKSEKDAYGRLLRYVWLDLPEDENSYEEVSSKMLNGILVYEGYACSKRYEPDVKHNDLFSEFQVDARKHDRGVSYYWA